MLTVNQLPPHLQGELYKNILAEYGGEEEQETPIGRPIKTDLVFERHSDILDMVDTCMFLAVDLPDALFRYVEENPETFLSQRANVASDKIEESFFMTTHEYRALVHLAEFHNVLYKWSPKISPYHLAGYAIQNQALVLLEYVCKRFGDEIDTQGVIQYAISCGHIPIIDYLVKVPFIKRILTPQYSQTLYSQVSNLIVLKYLRETLRFPWDEYVVEKALANNHIDCLQYALENGCPVFLESAAQYAFRQSTTDAIRLLVNLAGYKPNDEDMLYVAGRGSLDHMIYLRELGTPWHPQTVNSAARHKNHACMDYGIEHGAPYDSNIVELSHLPYSSDIDRWMATIIYN